MWITQWFGAVPGTPFGGYERSGIGRECAIQTIDEHSGRNP
ncbi:hypothetical protein [Halorubrum vacuolatum]|nr:hypothetical protein [Halorubrum vacuolatum]